MKNRKYSAESRPNGSVRFWHPTRFAIYCRDHGPAIIEPTGTIQYRNKFGLLHRTDGPAIIWWDSITEYWVNGKSIPKEQYFAMYRVL